MPNEIPKREVRFLARFKKDLKHYAKKYRRIRTDLTPLLEQLANGELIGNRVMGLSAILYKARIANSDARKGKSGGYCVLYFVAINEIVLLMTIYSKSEKEDVTSQELEEMLSEVDENLDSEGE
jgi:mRNA-degrading endonuclease RelE of RelBE toxin-antitoxin system